MSEPAPVQLDDILACPICCENFRPNYKIKQCREGHSICERCFGLVSDCPVCRKRFHGTRNFVMEELIKRLYNMDPETIKRSFVSFRSNVDEKTDKDDNQIVVKNLQWVSSTRNNFPCNAVLASYNKQEHPLYIGRVIYENALLPGKVNPQQKLCYFSDKGAEHSLEIYETLVSIHDTTENCWISCCDGDVPDNAFPVGQSADGEVLYVGRAFYKGVLTHGKVQPSKGACFLPFYGEEIRCRTYEVFVDVEVAREEINREESVDKN